MSDKLDTASLARQYATKMKAIANEMAALNEFYFDNGFNDVGSNPIVDADIVSTGITATELGDFINFTNQINYLMNNQTVTESDWSVVVNRIRNATL